MRTCIADSQAKIGDGVARSYVVTVDRAWGLAKADRFGKADPFISVKVAMQLRSVWPLNVCTTVPCAATKRRNSSEDSAPIRRSILRRRSQCDNEFELQQCTTHKPKPSTSKNEACRSCLHVPAVCMSLLVQMGTPKISPGYIDVQSINMVHIISNPELPKFRLSEVS